MIVEIKRLGSGQIGSIEWFWFHGAGWIQVRNRWCFYTRKTEVGNKEAQNGKYWRAHQIVIGWGKWKRLFGYYFVPKQRRFGNES